MTAPALVAIGTSWGGLHALSTILRGLAPAFPLPLLVVQHRSRESTSLLAELLQGCTDLGVRDVEDKEPVLPGSVYLAPPDYHLLVDRDHFTLTVDAPVRFSRPSIDVTFSSAADAFGRALIGVVLTGANDDGARGLACVVERGGHALVQDPDSAESAIMPLASLRRVPSAEVVTLDRIAPRLGELASPEARQVVVPANRSAS